jgi:hypothetical protein
MRDTECTLTESLMSVVLYTLQHNTLFMMPVIYSYTCEDTCEYNFLCFVVPKRKARLTLRRPADWHDGARRSPRHCPLTTTHDEEFQETAANRVEHLLLVVINSIEFFPSPRRAAPTSARCVSSFMHGICYCMLSRQWP